MKKFLGLTAVLTILITTALCLPESLTRPVTAEAADAHIAFSGMQAMVEGSGVTVQDEAICITAAGRYELTGEYTGQVQITAADHEDVTLVLNGATIACADGPAIYARSADKLILSLAQDTQNALADGSDYEMDDEGADAAVYAMCDLTITGEGTLTVNGNRNHGILTKDDLVIEGGNIAVTSVDDALRGKDSVQITGGTIALVAGGDGIKATHQTDAEKGGVEISGGALEITAEQDGIQAETDFVLSGGTLNIVTGDGSESVAIPSDAMGGNRGFNRTQTAETDTDVNSPSVKGIKAGGTMLLSGGTVVIDAQDDAVHAGGDIVISGGEYAIRSGDDAVHSDATLTVTGGSIVVTRCYEGLEGADVAVEDGVIEITSYDDGLNSNGGADDLYPSSFAGDSFDTSGSGTVTITGGRITVVSDGDSIDANGDLTIADGELDLTCNGNGNTALDTSGSYSCTGGTVTTNDGSEVDGGARRGGFGGRR